MVWQSSEVSAGDEILAEQYNDLRDDVVEVFESAVPLGSVTMWAGDSGDVPTGWALCDGSAISRSTYSDLYTLLGNTFGAGNGSTTFNLPDMRDRFVVGAGSSYSRNAKGGASSNNLSHTHSISSHTHSIAQHSHTVSSHRHSINSHSHTVNSHYHWTSTSNDGNSVFVSESGQTSAASRVITKKRATLLVNEQSTGTIREDATASSSPGTTGSGTLYTNYTAPGTSTNGATSTGGTALTTGSSGSSSQENRPPYIGLFYIIKVE
jgi:microcystin-dependent protein